MTSTALHQRIIERLKSGPVSTITLIDEFRSSPDAYTKEGVYKALRALLAEEIVVKHKKMISLNRLWLARQERFFREALGLDKEPSLAKLSEGDSIVYSFKTLALLDTHWGHIEVDLAQAMPAEKPIIMYCPHYWFALARDRSESALIRHLASLDRRIFITAGDVSSLDKSVRRQVESWGAEYALQAQPRFPRNYYLNIFGDFLIEVHLDASVSKDIDVWYQTYEAYGPESRSAFEILLKTEKRHRMKISRNAFRAQTLRFRFEKLFI